MQVVAEVAVGRTDPDNAVWIGITAVIVVVAYGVAVAVPNIWPVMVRVLPVRLIPVTWRHVVRFPAARSERPASRRALGPCSRRGWCGRAARRADIMPASR